MSVDQKQRDRAENFLKKYFNDGYIKNFQKIDGRDILAELGKAINDYENSKFFSGPAREPSLVNLRVLLSLINDALSTGVLISRNNRSVDVNPRKNFRTEVKDFLAKLCELCNYDTKKSVDAFEVGAKLHLGESKTEQIINYSIGKEWIYEPDRSFDRINTGDPRPSGRFRFVYVTSKGIDMLDEEEKPSVTPSQHIGDINTTNINNPERSQIQTGKYSTQNIVFSNEQNLRNILTQIEQINEDKGKEIPSDIKPQIKSKVRDATLELDKPNRDDNKIQSKIKSLGNTIKDLTPFAGLATQLTLLTSKFLELDP